MDKRAYIIDRMNGRDTKKLANNTYARKEGENIVIRLHNTDIAVFLPNGNVVLKTGGWQSSTTKSRINKFTQASIYQKNNVWYFNDGSVFYEGVSVRPDGSVVRPRKPEETEKRTKARKAKIKKFLDKVCQKAKEDGLNGPEAGDCLFCQMELQGRLIGGHVESHLKEGYVVPSMIASAFVHGGFTNPQSSYVVAANMAERGDTSFLRQVVRRYIEKQLPK